MLAGMFLGNASSHWLHLQALLLQGYFLFRPENVRRTKKLPNRVDPIGITSKFARNFQAGTKNGR